MGGGQSANAQCTGQITATFNWVSSGPGDDPPAVVVVEQKCLAAWNATWYGSAAAPQAKADDGLGFPERDTVTNAGPPETEQGQSGGNGPVGAYYSVQQNPGWEFSVTCNPAVSLSASSSANGGGGGSVQVVYSASASPVTIGLIGVITDSSGKSHVLVGQGVTATLNAPLPGIGCSWSIQGGNPFKNYEVGKAGDAPSQPVYTPLGAKDLALPTPHWYYAQPAGDINNPTQPQNPSQISCTALLVVPSGALPLPVSVSTQCVEDGPIVAQPVITMGTVQIVNTAIGFPEIVLLEAADPLGLNKNAGTWWADQVQTPAMYTAQKGGGWNFTQIVSSTSEIDYQDGTKRIVDTKGAFLLDTFFGYKPIYPDVWPANNSWQETSDSPGLSLVPNANNSPAVSASRKDTFKTYVLYMPPGNDTRWVALYSWTWTLVAQASYNQLLVVPQWVLTNANAQFQKPMAYPPQPTWSNNIQNLQ